jgi:hypothetical protein
VDYRGIDRLIFVGDGIEALNGYTFTTGIKMLKILTGIDLNNITITAGINSPLDTCILLSAIQSYCARSAIHITKGYHPAEEQYIL